MGQFLRLHNELQFQTPQQFTCLFSQVGIQMNYNKLCACVVEDAIHPNFVHALAKACSLPLNDSCLFPSMPCTLEACTHETALSLLAPMPRILA